MSPLANRIRVTGRGVPCLCLLRLERAEIDPDEAMDHLSQAMIELATAKDHLAGEDLPLRVASVDRLMARLQRQRERMDEA